MADCRRADALSPTPSTALAPLSFHPCHPPFLTPFHCPPPYPCTIDHQAALRSLFSPYSPFSTPSTALTWPSFEPLLSPIIFFLTPPPLPPSLPMHS